MKTAAVCILLVLGATVTLADGDDVPDDSAGAKESALHVGDLRRTDVAGARGVGMTTARIRARHDDLSGLPDADYVVGSHAELQSLLRGRGTS